MTTIIIATQNRVKLEAIKAAFEHLMDDKNIDVKGVYADSEVSRQPFNHDVFIGAENRLKNLEMQNYNADYFVSCESGIIKLSDTYYNVQYVIIKDKEGYISKGISQGFPIPNQYIDEIKTTSLAEVMDRIFNAEGGIRKLTQGLFNREKLIHDATCMALTGIINGNQWRIAKN